MASWHPRELALPVEWNLVYKAAPDPIAVIRRLERPPSGTDAAFRAVTWAAKSSDRELIGYYPTGDDAAAAAWQYFTSRSSDQHARAAVRAQDRPTPPHAAASSTERK